MQIDQITRAADNSVFRQEFRIIQSETRKKNVRMLCVYSSKYFPILAQLFLKEDCTAVFGRTGDKSLHCFGMTQDTSCRFWIEVS